MFRKGDRVRHPGRPEWDLGQVLEDSASGKVRVCFAGAGEKHISLSHHVHLEKVEGDDAWQPAARQPRCKEGWPQEARGDTSGHDQQVPADVPGRRAFLERVVPGGREAVQAGGARRDAEPAQPC